MFWQGAICWIILKEGYSIASIFWRFLFYIQSTILASRAKQNLRTRLRFDATMAIDDSTRRTTLERGEKHFARILGYELKPGTSESTKLYQNPTTDKSWQTPSINKCLHTDTYIASHYSNHWRYSGKTGILFQYPR